MAVAALHLAARNLAIEGRYYSWSAFGGTERGLREIVLFEAMVMVVYFFDEVRFPVPGDGCVLIGHICFRLWG